MQEHKIECTKVFDCAIKLPTEEENQLKFKNYEKRLKVPFVIYADCKAILEKKIENGPSNATRCHDIFLLDTI